MLRELRWAGTAFLFMAAGGALKNSSMVRSLLAVALAVGAVLPAAGQAGASIQPPRTASSAPVGGPVSPLEVLLVQPDGTTFPAVSWGDGSNNGYETLDGYTVVRQSDGIWVFASSPGPDGNLRTSAVGPVGASSPAPGTPKHLRPNSVSESLVLASPPGGTFVGIQRSLVLLVDFPNRTAVGTGAADWNARFFGATASVADFFKQASQNLLDLRPASESHGTANDGVVGWLRMPYNHPDTRGATGIANAQLTHDAIVAADPYVNFAAFDADGDGSIESRELHITVVVAGYETSYGGAFASCTPGVWGHWWLVGGPGAIVDGKTVAGFVGGDLSGYTQFGEWQCATSDNPGHAGTIGIIAHELGHDLGWPDLYDIDGSSAGTGRWSLMSSGAWNRTGSNFLGTSPALPDAFLRTYQGWVTPEEVTDSRTNVPISAGSVKQLGANPGGVDWSQSSGGTGEYFLIENRQLSGYDAGLPGCGLLIWHIDETRTGNSDETRKLVDLEEADGLDYLDFAVSFGDDGDPYPGSSANQLFNPTSNPNSDFYSGSESSASVFVRDTVCSPTMHADLTGVTVPPATCFGLVATVAGTEGGETLTGTSGNDVIAGLGGNDTILGLGGSDVVCGGAGDDLVLPGLGSDTQVDGGAGIDTISYADANTAMYVDLTANQAFVPGGGPSSPVDTFISFENAVASPLGGTLFGSDGPNTLTGLGGVDLLRGSAGNDVLEGGPGKDTYQGGSGNDLIRAQDGIGSESIGCGSGVDTVGADPSDVVKTDCESRTSDSAPTISDIPDQTTPVNTVEGPVPFTVGDLETEVQQLAVSGGSSNQTLVPNANITFGGAGVNRTVTVTPAANQTGTATITVSVTDGSWITQDTFIQTVTPATNTAPTISDIADQTTPVNTVEGPLAFTVGDAETAAGSLSVTGSSSNLALVPNANITFGGAGADRTVTVTPAANQTGTATITVTVSDGGLTGQDTFVQTVTAVSGATCFGLVATVAGTEGGETLTGTSGNDVIAGLGGNDTILGLGGSDVVCGGSGDDLVLPGLGSDTQVDGGAGIDTISYADANTAMYVDLTANQAFVPGGGPSSPVDTFISFENAVASPLGGTLFGSDGPNTLTGLGGVDLLRGSAGNDVLEGGPGKDTYQGGSGNDLIRAQDGIGSESIGCGSGVDTVGADPSDVVKTDCENRTSGAAPTISNIADQSARARSLRRTRRVGRVPTPAAMIW